jgi:hypothetical protein
MNEKSYVAAKRQGTGFGRALLVASLFAVVVTVLLAAGHASAARLLAIPAGAGFVEPVSGSIVQGIQSVVVSAPEYSLFHAELGVDGGNWQAMQNQGDGLFAVKWNSGHVPNGKHTLTARFSVGPGRLPLHTISIRVYVQNIDA